MADDAVQPRPQWSIRVVLIPPVERPSERVLGRVDRRVGISEDGEGDPTDVVGVIPVGPFNGAPAEVSVVHVSSTSERDRTLHLVVGWSRSAQSCEQATVVPDQIHPRPLGPDRRRATVPRQDADVVLEAG